MHETNDFANSNLQDFAKLCKKLQKIARKFAYIKKKYYFCNGFRKRSKSKPKKITNKNETIMKLQENNGTKRSMTLAILEAYERINGNLPQSTFDAIVKKMTSLTKERLQRYLEYIENGKDPNVDPAYCILLATNRRLLVKSLIK